MKIRLLVSRAGTGFSQVCGQVLTLPRAEGQKLIDIRHAELVELSEEEKAEDKKAEAEAKKTKAAGEKT